MAFKLSLRRIVAALVVSVLSCALVTMLYYGTISEVEPNTKFIAGVPVHNYHRRHYVSNHQSRSLKESRFLQSHVTDWVLMLHQNISNEQVHKVCLNDVGENLCLGEGHPSSGGIAFATIRATDQDLEGVLQSHPGEVLFVEPDAPMAMVPGMDDDMETRMSLTSQVLSWGLDRIDDRSGLDNSYDGAADGGNGVHVYVADTGIRTSHAEFGSRAIPTLEVVGNGVVECDGDSNCAQDIQGHGTHCAGTIGGAHYGVTKGATIHAVKVLSDSGYGSFSWFVEALDWVVTNGQRPAVFSASLGAQANIGFVEAAIDRATAAGVVVVVAAGNNAMDACGFSPAHAGSAITVGATRWDDTRAWYSNHGSCLDIFAPGSSIASAAVSSDTASATMSGTSMACPHVAGAAALILQQNESLTPTQVAERLSAVATSGVIKDSMTGSPNLLLYTGESPGSDPGCSKWADAAFQIRGSQEDYDRVMGVDCFSRKSEFDAIKNELGSDPRCTKWADAAFQIRGSQQDYDRVIGVACSLRKSEFDAIKKELGSDPRCTKWADAAFQIRGSQEDYDRVMGVDCSLRKSEFDAIKKELGSDPRCTKWADAAFQIRGSQEDYDRVMGVDCSLRKSEFDAIKKELGSDPRCTKWADAAFQIRGSQEDYDRVMGVDCSLRKSEFDAIKKELRSDPRCTKWADAAFQIRGSQLDYDRVMGVDCSLRNSEFDAVKNELGADPRCSKWAGAAFQIRGSQQDYDRVMGVACSLRESEFDAIKHEANPLTPSTASTSTTTSTSSMTTPASTISMSSTSTTTTTCSCRVDHACTNSFHHALWCYVDSLDSCSDTVQGSGGPWSEGACATTSSEHNPATVQR